MMENSCGRKSAPAAITVPRNENFLHYDSSSIGTCNNNRFYISVKQNRRKLSLNRIFAFCIVLPNYIFLALFLTTWVVFHKSLGMKPTAVKGMMK